MHEQFLFSVHCSFFRFALCIYIYTYVYVSMYLYIYVYIHIYICIHIYAYIFICVYISLYAHVCVHIHVWTRMVLYASACSYIDIHLHTCNTYMHTLTLFRRGTLNQCFKGMYSWRTWNVLRFQKCQISNDPVTQGSPTYFFKTALSSIETGHTFDWKEPTKRPCLRFKRALSSM